jgi:hypothetical protein
MKGKKGSIISVTAFSAVMPVARDNDQVIVVVTGSARSPGARLSQDYQHSTHATGRITGGKPP